MLCDNFGEHAEFGVNFEANVFMQPSLMGWVEPASIANISGTGRDRRLISTVFRSWVLEHFSYSVR